VKEPLLLPAEGALLCSAQAALLPPAEGALLFPAEGVLRMEGCALAADEKSFMRVSSAAADKLRTVLKAPCHLQERVRLPQEWGNQGFLTQLFYQADTRGSRSPATTGTDT
jgi:hypothetical protein